MRSSAPRSAVILACLGLVVGALGGCAGEQAAAPAPPVALAELGAATEGSPDGQASGEADGLEDEAIAAGERGEGAASADTEVQRSEEGGGEAVQEITFEGEDADPALATEVRSAPKRPTLPSFRLFGTRSGDGP